jgi:septum formation protein
MRLTLASSSPRRIEILEKFHIEFEVIPSNIIEPEPLQNEDPISFAKRISFLKAKEVSLRVKRGIILGVDTIVEFNNIIMGKPKDREDAENMIKLLSGKIHRVISGFTIIRDNTKVIKDAVITAVKFYRLTEEEIQEYLDKETYLGKAGAYAIQEEGAKLIEYIKGCYYNVIGLPIWRIMEVLESLKVEEDK